eukprot:scaffold69159_cov118-Phaeocystis_antarctica.AAC.1
MLGREYLRLPQVRAEPLRKRVSPPCATAVVKGDLPRGIAAMIFNGRRAGGRLLGKMGGGDGPFLATFATVATPARMHVPKGAHRISGRHRQRVDAHAAAPSACARPQDMRDVQETILTRVGQRVEGRGNGDRRIGAPDTTVAA